MNNNCNKISVRQTCALIILEVLGVGFVVIPRFALVLAWRDGFAAIILASVIIGCYTAFILKIINKYGGLDLFRICESSLGSVPAKLLRWGFVVKTVLFTGFCLRMFAETVTQVVEADIPVVIIMLTMGLCTLYPAVMGRQVRGRLAELLLVPVLAVLVFVFACGITRGGNDELLPVLSEGGRDIAAAAFSIILWFYPIEYVLMSLPYIKNRDKLKKSCAWTTFGVGMLIAAIFALTLVRFGGAQMRSMDYPVLEMMYSVNLPGSFIERQEGLMMGIWVTGVFFTVGGGIYHSGLCAAEMLKGISSNIASALCVLGAFAIGLLPDSGGKAGYYMINVVLFTECAYLIVLPLVLCLALFWEGRKNEAGD